MRTIGCLLLLAACGGARPAAPLDDGGQFVIHTEFGDGFETYTIERTPDRVDLEAKAETPGHRQFHASLELTAAWRPLSGTVEAASGALLIWTSELHQPTGFLSVETRDDTGTTTMDGSGPIDVFLTDTPPFAPLTVLCVAADEGRRTVAALRSVDEGEVAMIVHDAPRGLRRVSADYRGTEMLLACDGPLLLGVEMHHQKVLRVGREDDATAVLAAP